MIGRNPGRMPFLGADSFFLISSDGYINTCVFILSPQFVVIHTVNKTEVGIFLEFSCFFNDPADVCNLISGFSAFF